MTATLGTHLVRGIALAAAIVSGCTPSRERSTASADSAPVGTPVPTVDISAASEVPVAASTPEAPIDTTPAIRLIVPFADFFDVDRLGNEEARGSGCGVEQFIGNKLPDGLWRGFVRSFDGLWVDGSTSLKFDIACVYYGDAALLMRQRWIGENPGEQPMEVRDGFMVNDNDRVRMVPLASGFVQADAVAAANGGCIPPDPLPPSGSTAVYRLLDSWLLVEAGEAGEVLTSCPGD